MDGKSINRFNSLRKFVELDPTFCGHDELPIFTSTSTRSEKQNCIAAHEAWVKKASQAYYRYKKRFNCTHGPTSNLSPAEPHLFPPLCDA
eukprot:6076857-Prymnesium_polylepis.1